MDKKITDEFIFDHLFNERKEFVKFCFDVYREIYDLQEIKYEGEVSQELFNYCINRDFFLLLVIFDDDGKIYLESNIQEKLYWALPGGSILKNEDFHSAAKRICCDKINTNLNIDQLEPVAHIVNKFRYCDKIHLHYGMAFVARAVNCANIDLDNSIGNFVRVDDNELEKVNRFANREVLRISRKKKLDKNIELFENELDKESRKRKYDLHNNLIKKYLLTSSIKKKKIFFEKLREHIGEARNFLDVSCGDSDIVSRVEDIESIRYVVGNDIDWDKIGIYHKSKGKSLFTNHDASKLPFNDKCFDVAYLGNTLHHISDKKKMIDLLDNIARVAKKIIITEIQKPSDTGIIPTWLNKYLYEGWLEDKGNIYLTKQNFETLIKRKFGKYDVMFDEFRNIQGNYLIAVIHTGTDKYHKKSQLIEVEEKYFCKDIVFVREMAENLGYLLKNSSVQKDTYFSDINGEYIKNRVCLRIRVEDNASEITFKGPSKDKSHCFAKSELNMQIRPKDKNTMKELLSELGFLKFIDVIKRRETYTKTLDGYVSSISIDTVNKQTDFVEFELIMEDVSKTPELVEKMQYKLKKIVEIFEPAMLSPANMPYRDYVSSHLCSEVLKLDEISNLILCFDGVIVPTEKLFFTAYSDVAKEIFGVNIGVDDYIKSGMTKSDANKQIFDRLVFGNAEIIGYEDYMKKVYEIFESRLDILCDDEHMSNNFSLIRDLKNLNYRLGLIGSLNIKYIDRFFLAYDAYDLFEEVISRENMDKDDSKLENYLKLIERMNISKKNTLVLENNTEGINAARLGDINCIGISNNLPAKKAELEKLGVCVFDSLVQVGLYIRSEHWRSE